MRQRYSRLGRMAHPDVSGGIRPGRVTGGQLGRQPGCVVACRPVRQGIRGRVAMGPGWSWVVALALWGSAVMLRGAPQLAEVFGDNMVLQQNLPVSIWGRAAPGESVTVRFAGQEQRTVADAAGRWRLTLAPLPASATPAELTIAGAKHSLTLTNILVGEIWLCSGQSNMGMMVLDALNPEQEIAAARHPNIRLLRADLRWGWHVCSPEAVKEFSAVGYFFGRRLNRELNVPIGLICASVGATAIEQWIPLSAFEQAPEFSGLVRAYREALTRLPEKRKQAEAAAAAWDRDQRPTTQTDPGDQGFAKGYARPDFDDSTWQTMELPQAWESEPGMELDGVVWFRKALDIPERWRGKALQLCLGPVDDFDVTYFNGVRVGAIGAETPRFHAVMRQYTVPAELVRPGRNVVAVRVFDHFASGGFTGSRLMMRLYAEDEYDFVPLAGPWRYRVEVALDPKALKWPTRPFASLGVPNLGSLYGKIEPLVPFGIRGVIWYQGENNADGCGGYDRLLRLLIESWRAAWNQGPFPFLIVQLANHGNPCDVQENSGWALLREEQFLAAASIPQCGIATAVDIGDAVDIHPKNKQEVGNRLALVALSRVYGKRLECLGPVYDTMAIENGRARLRFQHIGSGLTVKGGPLRGFAIAGSDGRFIPARAVLDGDTVVVWHEQVPAPVSVRYAWANNPARANLYNREGLPAFPFRTDRPQ